MINRIKGLLYYLVNFAFYKYLDWKAVVFFSVRVQGKKYIVIGKNSIVQRLGWLLALKIDEHDPAIVIEEGCAIGDFCHIAAVRSIHIEKNVLMANHVYIADNVHEFENTGVPVIHQKVKFKMPVRIGSGAWIGENVCIIGASVGRNSVVGANAVVTKDIPDYCVAVGSPARIIKKYDPEKREWLIFK
ncbi:Hexapeptide repeat of succinyl-transferase [Chitinophaga rupis]|uniref:Hexapeptide repeat of succinyl-transferase n=1 Tax=Chitinophaga rupis TaxID=573321 RepID=A0A1H7LPQ8_9BACT|nr:acyltransferase [Chitinophaga rupis]SEL00829.1 Hexapeptide repeat of succinyl-transferase [Chitinophaga rupis]